MTELTEIYTLFEPRSNDVKEGSINTRLCASAKDPGTYLHPESELFAWPRWSDWIPCLKRNLDYIKVETQHYTVF